MVQTESIGFWVSFISSVIGIVLSIVAIIFSVLVDRRSSSISDKTIQSLQKIESAVERSSSDTRELIKAGWDKMLGQVDRDNAVPSSDTYAKQMAAGIAAELRSEMTAVASQAGNAEQQAKTLEKYLKELEASLSAQLKIVNSDPKSDTELEVTIDQISGLDKYSFALLRAIRARHLSQNQYRLLTQGRLGKSVHELRKQGLLVPVVHKTSSGSMPCYYMPPGISKIVKKAFALLPKPGESIEAEIASDLERVGYNQIED